MSIKTELELDPSKAVNQAGKAATEIGGKLSKAYEGDSGKGLFSGAESGLTKLQSGISVLGTIKTFFTDIGGLAKGQVDLGERYDDLLGVMQMVLPAGSKLEDELARLDKMMAAPGVAWEPALKTHAALMAMKVSAADSEEIIKEVGNALMLTGDEAHLEEVVASLVKIDDKGAVAAKQIAALASQSVTFRKAFTASFGTSNASEIEALGLTTNEFIQGILAGLKSLDRASLSGAENIAKKVDQLRLAQMKIDSSIAGAIPGGTDSAPGESTAADAMRERLAAARAKRLGDMKKEIELGSDLAESKRREADITKEISQATPDQAAKLNEALNAEKRRTDEIQLQLTLNKSLLQTMKEKNLTEAEATAYLRLQLKSQRDISDGQAGSELKTRKDDNERQLSKRDRDNKIAEAEAAGHSTKAKKLQRSAAIEDKTKELTDLGVNEAEAKSRAEKEVQTSEDAAYRDKTGRRRIHGIKNQAPAASDPYKRVGDPQFASLDKIAAMQTDPSRNAPTPSARPAADNPAAEVGKAMEKALDPLVKLITPLLKKMGAEPLKRAS